MLGNIMELKSPTSRMLHIAIYPDVSIEVNTKAEATVAKTPAACR